MKLQGADWADFEDVLETLGKSVPSFVVKGVRMRYKVGVREVCIDDVGAEKFFEGFTEVQRVDAIHKHPFLFAMDGNAPFLYVIPADTGAHAAVVDGTGLSFRSKRKCNSIPCASINFCIQYSRGWVGSQQAAKGHRGRDERNFQG